MARRVGKGQRPTFEQAVQDTTVVDWLLDDYDRQARTVVSQLRVEPQLRVTADVVERQARLLKIHDTILEAKNELLRRVLRARNRARQVTAARARARERSQQTSRRVNEFLKTKRPGVTDAAAARHYLQRTNEHWYTYTEIEQRKNSTAFLKAVQRHKSAGHQKHRT